MNKCKIKVRTNRERSSVQKKPFSLYRPDGRKFSNSYKSLEAAVKEAINYYAQTRR